MPVSFLSRRDALRDQREGWVTINRSVSVERFYTSRIWRNCRKQFIKAKQGICERCLAKGIINAGSDGQPLEVHHIIPLDDDNISDPNITLNWNNLELLCKQCHDSVKPVKPKRWRVDPEGHVIPR